MDRLQILKSGKLTAYQIATATGIDIETIDKLLSNELTVESLEPEAYSNLLNLDTCLFTSIEQK